MLRFLGLLVICFSAVSDFQSFCEEKPDPNKNFENKVKKLTLMITSGLHGHLLVYFSEDSRRNGIAFQFNVYNRTESISDEKLKDIAPETFILSCTSSSNAIRQYYQCGFNVPILEFELDLQEETVQLLYRAFLEERKRRLDKQLHDYDVFYNNCSLCAIRLLHKHLPKEQHFSETRMRVPRYSVYYLAHHPLVRSVRYRGSLTDQDILTGSWIISDLKQLVQLCSWTHQLEKTLKVLLLHRKTSTREATHTFFQQKVSKCLIHKPQREKEEVIEYYQEILWSLSQRFYEKPADRNRILSYIHSDRVNP